MTAEKRDVLRRVRAFAALGDDDCDAVLRVLKARRGSRGDVLFRQGDPGASLMIVLEGTLVARVRADSGSGEEQEVARLGPGEVVGEMAFIDAEPRSATVVTGSDSVTILDFTRDALGALVRDAPRVASAILRNVLFDVARRLREAGERLSAGVGPSASGPTSLGRAGRGLTVERLRTLPAFSRYGEEDLELLVHIATLRAFASGEVLMREGADGEHCWLVASGSVTVTRESAAAPIATLGPGALVGQLALLDRAPRSASVTAAEDTITLEIPAAAFANLLRASSPLALRFQWQVALAGVKQLRDATKQLAAKPQVGEGMRMFGDMDAGWDDWDQGGTGQALELAIDPASLRR
jgi:CRP/FNR family cyclic AMP-dependent transcriptional regulator